MIPYIEWTTIQLGPLTLHVWGLFVALGFLVGALAAGWLARRQGDNDKVIYDLAAWMIVAGMLGGRLGHVLFYEFSHYVANPLEIFAIWEGGLSMFGGLITCAVVGVWYLRNKKVDVARYASTTIFGLPFGMAIGRIGCFLIHDHPGTATHFFLGVKYPDGATRHDHGLYEAINGAILSIVFIIMARRGINPLWYMVVFAVEYGLFRLITDAWRTADTRYVGLTPGQYLGFVLMAGGIGAALWIIRRRRKI